MIDWTRAYMDKLHGTAVVFANRSRLITADQIWSPAENAELHRARTGYPFSEVGVPESAAKTRLEEDCRRQSSAVR